MIVRTIINSKTLITFLVFYFTNHVILLMPHIGSNYSLAFLGHLLSGTCEYVIPHLRTRYNSHQSPMIKRKISINTHTHWYFVRELFITVDYMRLHLTRHTFAFVKDWRLLKIPIYLNCSKLIIFSVNIFIKFLISLVGVALKKRIRLKTIIHS